eukprot:TRINITY_DN21844_c0_g1_i1.p1 TRINITY_DN21844_c0_g1~~TRINITY_DN21844_c0_g1_i1.p1  ORF type:complete len:155 (+),score=48.17 TRINITY_DN21844_c0_g1_i1:178-642(+)
MPKVKNFLHNHAPQFPAVEVQWIGGKSPTVVWLDKYGQRTGEDFDISGMDEDAIKELLASKGITADTPKPEWEPKPLTPTADCVAWRQTGECRGDGPREGTADSPCEETIQSGRSGFCECQGGARAEHSCGHEPLSCEAACKALRAGSPAEGEL